MRLLIVRNLRCRGHRPCSIIEVSDAWATKMRRRWSKIQQLGLSTMNLELFLCWIFLNRLLEVERPIESIGQACLLNELLSERAWPRVNGDEPRLLDEKLAFGLAGVQESLLSGKVNQTTGWWSPLQYSPLLTPHHTTIRADLSISHKLHRHTWDLNDLCIQFCYLRSRWNGNKSLSLSLSFFTYRFAVPYTRFFAE